jgi:hypothetical protein
MTLLAAIAEYVYEIRALVGFVYVTGGIVGEEPRIKRNSIGNSLHRSAPWVIVALHSRIKASATRGRSTTYVTRFF